MSRRSNPEICDAFRELLTSGCPEELREPTRAWRSALWRAFTELQGRLCPVPPEPAINDDRPSDVDVDAG